ncbi:MAG: hypothetical protein C0592_01520 [Marinilabiliales bacterium]|nr:MAG: hypothetical protein C0592_01520 [Marinilabiliales bacterium]
MRFSFTSEKPGAIVQHVKQVFPMLSRVMAMTIMDENYQLLSLNSGEEDREHGSMSSEMMEFFSRLKDYEWKLEEDLPFHLEEEKSLARNLFEEMDRNVLVIRENSDDFPLYLFLYFDKSKKHFGMLKNDDAFSMENREIIAQMAFNSIKAFGESRKKDLEVLGYIRQSMESMAWQQSTGEKGQSGEIRLLEKMIVEMASEYLINIGREQNLQLALSPDAREKIAAFRGSPPALREMLYQAASLASNLQAMGDSDRKIIIENWQLLSVQKKAEEHSQTETPLIQHRYLKTYQLLDRLEDAVKTVLDSRQSVTGANVGKSMETPISAPAISDAMKKHRAKIVSLMQQFPERWSLLRNHFKPVQNILIPKHLKESRSA